MIRFSIQFISFAFLMVFLTGCATNDIMIRTLEGDNADFSSFKTFYVLPDPPMADDPNFYVRSYPRQVVEKQVRKQLTNRNYKETQVKEEADFFVAIQYSLKEEQRERNVTNHNNHHLSYGRLYGGSRWGYGHRRHYRYRTFATSEIQIEKFSKGNLIVDIIDAKKNTLVWEAFAASEIMSDLEEIEEKITKVVAEVFNKYLYTAKVATS